MVNLPAAGRLTDLGVQFLNRLLGFLSFPSTFAKHIGRAFQQLFFPVANLVGMHIELLHLPAAGRPTPPW